MRIELFKLDLHNLVEFSISASDENYKICSSESFFMEEQVFYLFQSCFEESSKLFDYYEPTKFGLRNIIPLQNHLKELGKELESVNSPESFAKFITERSMGVQYLELMEKEDPDWSKEWNKHQKNLSDVCQKLILLTEQCLNEDKVLWVKGN